MTPSEHQLPREETMYSPSVADTALAMSENYRMGYEAGYQAAIDAALLALPEEAPNPPFSTSRSECIYNDAAKENWDKYRQSAIERLLKIKGEPPDK